MFAVGGAASLRRYNHPMSASISPARRELTQLSATETNALPEDLLRAILRELEYLVPDDCVGDMVCRFDSPPDTSAVSPLRITNVRTDGEGNRYVLA